MTSKSIRVNYKPPTYNPTVHLQAGFVRASLPRRPYIPTTEPRNGKDVHRLAHQSVRSERKLGASGVLVVSECHARSSACLFLCDWLEFKWPMDTAPTLLSQMS